ncbi:MAG: GNAT family N-acetyltransferase [Sphingomonas sp.]|nr:GNAT family N-acetyltransferase [Sphingomonas sp.]
MFARTPRLTLRPGWLEDAPALAQAIAYPEVVRHLSRVPWPYREADARAFLAMPPAPGEVRLLILAHEGGAQPRLIGGIGLHQGEAAPELGYWLTPSAWGRGYATEAGRAVLDMARHALGLKRVESSYFIDNIASARVQAKLGFRPLGRVIARHCRATGEDKPCALTELDLVESDTSPLLIAA